MTRSSPRMLLTACSSGRVIWDSISSGPVFGQLTFTLIVGMSIFGKRSIGNRRKQMNPSNTNAAIRIVTATGLLTASFPTFTSIHSFRSVGHFCQISLCLIPSCLPVF